MTASNMAAMWLWLLLAVLLASPAAAVQILPVHDGRVVSWIRQNGTLEELTPGPGFPVFAENLNIVGGPGTGQNTSIAATQMGGAGGVFVNTGAATNVVSAFDVSFRVDEGVAYALSGLISGGVSEVLLSGPSGVLFGGPPPSQGRYFPFSVTGTLAPGTDYRLRIALDVPSYEVEVGGNWNFAFSITPLPEVSTLGMFGAAVLFAASRRRTPRGVGVGHRASTRPQPIR
jgi:hypothetical protein